MLVVVRLDNEVVRGTDIFLHLGIHRAAVGHEHKALPLIIDAVPEAVGRVMLDMEGIDMHTEELPLHASLEIASAGAQFLAHAIVTIDTLVNLRRSVYRESDAFAKRTYGPDMIGMVMGNEHAHDIMKIQPHIAQIFLNLARRDAGVNEDTPLTRTEVVAVSATSAGKTPEYKSVFLHNTKSAAKVLKIFHVCKHIYFFSKKICACHFFFVPLHAFWIIAV